MNQPIPISEERIVRAQECLGILKTEVEQRLFGQSTLVLQAIIGPSPRATSSSKASPASARRCSCA